MATESSCTHLECGEGIRSNVKGGYLNILKEVVKVITVKNNSCQCLIPGTLPQHCATVESNILMFIPAYKDKKITDNSVYQ